MPPRVFANTGLEYPEIVEHVKSFSNVVYLKPKMGFTRVVKEIGVAVISKDVAQKIREILNTKSDKLRNKRMYGDKNGNGKLPVKWRPFLEAPFPISDKCCEIFKKEPFRRYERETGRHPIVFTTTEESTQRVTSYLRTGCNTFDEGREKSRPMSIFTEDNIWDYHNVFGIRFAEVYYDRTVPVVQLDGSVKVEHLEAVDRTGCTFCLFGIHLEDKTKNNRIQKLAISHPKYYDIVINKCGLGSVLKWMGIPFKPFMKCGKQQDLFKQAS